MAHEVYIRLARNTPMLNVPTAGRSWLFTLPDGGRAIADRHGDQEDRLLPDFALMRQESRWGLAAEVVRNPLSRGAGEGLW